MDGNIFVMVGQVELYCAQRQRSEARCFERVLWNGLLEALAEVRIDKIR